MGLSWEPEQTSVGALSLEPGPVLFRTCLWGLEGCWKKTGVKCV